MIFKTPFVEFQEVLYEMLTTADEMEGLQAFDSGSPIEEILDSFQDFEEIKYLVISDVNCTQLSGKADTIIWHVTARIELFSTYQGRKAIAEMMNLVGSVATQYQDVFDAKLWEKGYRLNRMDVGECVTGNAMSADGIRWQNGYMTLNYYLEQEE